MGTKLNPGKYECYANAEPDEPMFVLLGRDDRAPSLVEAWAAVSESRGTDPAKVREARECAAAMRKYRAERSGPRAGGASSLEGEESAKLRPGQAHALAAVQTMIADMCDGIKEMLLAKNRAYGNSALEPLRVFSKAPTDEQINVRIDDKLSRIARGQAAGEDVELDLIGYLVLKRVLAKRDGR